MADIQRKTANLFDTFDIIGQVPTIGTGELINYNGSTTSLIPIDSGLVTLTKPLGILIYLMLYSSDNSFIGYTSNSSYEILNGNDVTGYENAKYCRVRIDRTTELNTIQIMLNAGSTALPYEPYWTHSLKKFDGAAWQNATVHEF